MALTQIDDRGLKTPIDLLDNEKIRLGTGNDLEIYHNGSNSFIKDTGTGALAISGSQVSFDSSDSSEYMIKATENAAVELYYNGSKKLETNNDGIALSGDINLGSGTLFTNDNGKLRLGGSQDLEIYHNGTNSYLDNNTGHLAIRTNVGSDVGSNIYLQPHDNEDGIVIVHDGGVELYYDNSKKFSTINAGAYVTGSFGVGAATNPSHNYNQGIHVHATGTGATLHLTDNTSGSGADDGFDVLSNAGEAFLWQRENASMRFGTNATERMRLTSSGQLLIGTTSTTGISAGSDDIVIGSIGDSTYRGLTFATTTEAAIRWADAGDNAMGRIEYSNSADTMTFNTANATRMRLDSDGMKFGTDTAAANALDDYEEGSYTPVIYYDSTNNHTYSEQLGLYTKIGNFVYGTIAITWDKQNSTGQVGISLPVTSANVAGTRTTGYCVYQDGLSIPSGQGSTHLIGYGGQNASSMYFYFTGGTNNSELGGSSTQLTDSHTSSNNVMRIVFHYRTA